MNLIQIVKSGENGENYAEDYSAPIYEPSKIANLSGMLMDMKIVGSGIRGVKNLVQKASGAGVDDLVYGPEMPNATIPTEMSGAPQKNLGWMHTYEITTDEGREPELTFNNPESIIPSYTKKLIGENKYRVDVLIQTKPGANEELLEITLNDIPVGVDDEKDFKHLLPANPTLSQNWPNPFNPSTQAEYILPKRSDVTIDVYNVNGELIQSLFKGEMLAGTYRVTWDGKKSDGNDAASGMYLLQMRTPTYQATKKMVKLK